MSTAPAPFSGDSDPAVEEALRRISAVNAEEHESRADRCVAAVVSLLERGTTVEYYEPRRRRARQLFAEAAARTEQPAWVW